LPACFVPPQLQDFSLRLLIRLQNIFSIVRLLAFSCGSGKRKIAGKIEKAQLKERSMTQPTAADSTSIMRHIFVWQQISFSTRQRENWGKTVRLANCFLTSLPAIYFACALESMP